MRLGKTKWSRPKPITFRHFDYHVLMLVGLIFAVCAKCDEPLSYIGAQQLKQRPFEHVERRNRNIR